MTDMYELSGAELDAVAAGHGALVDLDLRNINVEVKNNRVLTNFLNDSINDNSVLNDNQVPIGIAVAVLGQAAAFVLAGR